MAIALQEGVAVAGPLFNIEFKGLAEAQAQMAHLQDLLEFNLRKAVARTVLWAAGQIAEDTPVDTGLLRASIGGQLLDTSVGGKRAAEGRTQSLTAVNGLTGVIGTAVKYAVYQEFGWTATGPKKLTPKQLRFLFATGILKRGPGGRVIPGGRTVTQTYYKPNMRQAGRKIVRQYRITGTDVAIQRRAGIKTHVKGRGFFRKNVPAIRQYFYASCQEAISLALQGREMKVSY